MYPSLTSIGSGSRWYSKKQTPQEILMDITYMEQELARKREFTIEVDVPIKIRGKLTVSNKMMNMEKDDDRMDDRMDEEEEEEEDNMMIHQQQGMIMEEGEEEEEEEDNPFIGHNNNYNQQDLYNMYDPEEDEEERDFQDLRGRPLPSPTYTQDYNNYQPVMSP